MYTSSLSNGTTFFGLPGEVKEIIKKYRGIYDLYDWQIQCLTLESVKRKENLIYSLPTSGGKTLVAEILMLKEIILYRKNVIFILPFVALVQEKINLLSSFGLELGFFIEEYSGSKGVYPPPKRRKKRSIFICTIEKALGLINSLIEEKRIQEVGLVVVDELHLVGESVRGAILENLLTKVLHVNGIQIIGMSATIGNMHDLATFLRAHIYSQDFRPIELEEYIKVEDEIFLVDKKLDIPLVFYKSLKIDKLYDRLDPDNIGFLVKEVVPLSSCLVFCPSKSNCENVALMVCQSLKHHTYIDHKRKEKEDLLKALLTEGNGNVCPILRKTLRYGVAYHHSGLTTAERKLIEEAYISGSVYCICCTSTLAAGVNLPAQRVILRSPYVGTQFINLSKYKQMIGRAGRAGLGEKGDSFLICKPMDAPKVGSLLTSPMDICRSQLINEELNNFIVSLISLNLASNKASIMKYVNSTLLKVQAHYLQINIDDEVERILTDLVNTRALEIGDFMKLTPLAKAAVKGNFSYSLANQLYNDLIQAQKCLVLENDLHLLYLITPYKFAADLYEPKHDVLFEVYSSLGSKELNVAQALGINEVCINVILAGRKVKSVCPMVLQRFFISLIIYDLWKGNNIWKVSSKFRISRGDINNLLGATASFASAVIRFCEELEEMWCFTKLLSAFPQKLDYCGDSELTELLQLPAVKLGRAKQLYNAGYKDLASIAKSEPLELVSSIHHLPIKQAKQIVSVAKLLVLSKFESLQEEAETLLQNASMKP